MNSRREAIEREQEYARAKAVSRAKREAADAVNPHTECIGRRALVFCGRGGCRELVQPVFGYADILYRLDAKPAPDGYADILYRLDAKPASDGPWVLEQDENRLPMVVGFNPEWHVGWMRYRQHVCAGAGK